MSRIERADLEAKLTEIEQAWSETAATARKGSAVAALAVVAVIAVAFLWGRRKGRRASAKVEIYRVA